MPFECIKVIEVGGGILYLVYFSGPAMIVKIRIE